MNELASNHAEVNTRVLDRIGDWKHHLKEAVLLENNGGKENEQEFLEDGNFKRYDRMGFKLPSCCKAYQIPQRIRKEIPQKKPQKSKNDT
jgi:hypothetical protein